MNERMNEKREIETEREEGIVGEKKAKSRKKNS